MMRIKFGDKYRSFREHAALSAANMKSKQKWLALLCNVLEGWGGGEEEEGGGGGGGGCELEEGEEKE